FRRGARERCGSQTQDACEAERDQGVRALEVPGQAEILDASEHLVVQVERARAQEESSSGVARGETELPALDVPVREALVIEGQERVAPGPEQCEDALLGRGVGRQG